MTDEDKLICINRQNGHIRWITQLPQFQKAKSKKGQIDYLGPVLAGGRLIITGSNGALIVVDFGWPRLGWTAFMVRAGTTSPISSTPPVTDCVLYLMMV